ncbi:MAG TPA: IS4 family transposase [Isosphaeraceae bacterium]|nr:IS4 family transposase [Isosphaeraceae bacterium]
MFVDHIRRGVWDQLRQRDFRAFAPILTAEVFQEAATRAGVALGGGPLCLMVLVWLGIACALHPTKSFASVLGLALKLLQNDARWHPDSLLPKPASQPKPPPPKARRRGSAKSAKAGRPHSSSPQAAKARRSKHDPRGDGDPWHVSTSAFTQARQAMPWGIWVALVVVLSERFEDQYAETIRFKDFRLLALDGTKLDLYRWTDLRRRAGAAANGRALSSPRARLVLLEFPLARLPVRFDLVPYGVGERTAAEPLLDVLRRGDLLLIDRGFWGYGMFRRIQASRADFAIRLVSGVKCRTVRGLGLGDRLAQWKPTKAQREGDEEGAPVLDLRLIDYQIKGFRPSTLVTSVTDPERISREELIRLATVDEAGRVLEAGLYHRRWEIETTFLELKKMQGMAGPFRSRTTEGIAYEVAGHLMLYTLVRLLMAEVAAQSGTSPLRLSYKGAVDEVRDMGESLLKASQRHAQRFLRPRLLELISSHRVAYRPNRHFPRPNDTKAKTDRHGKKQPPHKVSRRIRSIALKRPPSPEGDASRTPSPEGDASSPQIPT